MINILFRLNKIASLIDRFHYNISGSESPSVTGDGGWCGAETDCGTHENARREGGGWVEEGGREGSQYVSHGAKE